MIYKSYRTEPMEPKRASIPSGTVRLTGGEQIMARDHSFLAWLAKCYREQSDGVRDWKCFDNVRLRDFLTAAGVDLEAQAKAAGDGNDIPALFDALEHGVDKLRGASFLNGDAYKVASFLRHKRALARA